MSALVFLIMLAFCVIIWGMIFGAAFYIFREVNNTYDIVGRAKQWFAKD